MRQTSLLVVLFVTLLLALVPPTAAVACNYYCETGCDETMSSCHAHCYLSLNNPAYMASCTEKQMCYKTRNGGVYCDYPRCEGTPCYQV